VLTGIGVMVTLACTAVGVAYFQVAGATSAAAPPPAPAMGSVMFTSQPTGATVAIDSVVRGVTPLKLSIPVGSHEVRISVGDATRALPLSVEAGTAMSQHFEFAPAVAAQTGRLDVTTDPPGARVTIDGTARGRTPLSLASIPAGEHKIIISDNDATIVRTVTVAPGATASVMATISEPGSAAGYLQIKSPIELQVFEGGLLIGSTRATRLMLPAGRHDLEVANTALEFRTTVHLAIDAGKTAAPIIDVPSGSLSINALPWATVTLDGRALGTTPLGNVSVPIGTHEVVWRHPQLGERRQTVTVTAHSPVRIGMDLTK
jgi:hypothetical protein